MKIEIYNIQNNNQLFFKHLSDLEFDKLVKIVKSLYPEDSKQFVEYVNFPYPFDDKCEYRAYRPFSGGCIGERFCPKCQTVIIGTCLCGVINCNKCQSKLIDIPDGIYNYRHDYDINNLSGKTIRLNGKWLATLDNEGEIVSHRSKCD